MRYNVAFFLAVSLVFNYFVSFNTNYTIYGFFFLPLFDIIYVLIDYSRNYKVTAPHFDLIHQTWDKDSDNSHTTLKRDLIQNGIVCLDFNFG